MLDDIYKIFWRNTKYFFILFFWEVYHGGILKSVEIFGIPMPDPTTQKLHHYLPPNYVTITPSVTYFASVDGVVDAVNGEQGG